MHHDSDYPILRNNYPDWKLVALEAFERLRQVNFAQRVVEQKQEFRIYSVGFRGTTYYITQDGKKRYMAVELGKDDYPTLEMISDFFNELPRMKGIKKGFKSMNEEWEINKPMLIHEIALKNPGASKYELNYMYREAMWMRYGNKKAECTQHKPVVAASVYTFLRAKKILDPCSGWGDRLIAALAVGCEKYVGVDPNKDLAPGYSQIKSLFDRGNVATMVCDRFETFNWSNSDEFDIAYTSPPYFDLEIYSDAETQSTYRYRAEETWVNEFFKPMLDNCIRYVRNGGHIAINIVDFYGTSYVPKMIEHMEYRGQFYRGVIAYAGGRGVYMPIFVWQVRK